MFLIRGVMLAGKFRSQHQLNTMSHDDMRNTLIVEIAGRSRQTGLQAFDDNTLAGMGAVLVFLRTARIRDDATLKGMTSDDMRNILIVELGGQTGMSGRALQAMSNIELVKLGLGKPQPGGLTPGSYIRGVLLAGQFRTQHELDGMSSDDMRNTLIVEMAAHSNQTNYQALNDFQLAGVGAVMIFLREARLRTDAELKAMSADDQRNVAIVEIGAQTKLGSRLQGLSNMDLVLTAFGMEPINTGRMCNYLDAPGTPQIGIKPYGVKGRRSHITDDLECVRDRQRREPGVHAVVDRQSVQPLADRGASTRVQLPPKWRRRHCDRRRRSRCAEPDDR